MNENRLQEAFARLRRHLPEPLWDAANSIVAKYLSEKFADKYLPVGSPTPPSADEQLVSTQEEMFQRVHLYLLARVLLALSHDRLRAVFASNDPFLSLTPYLLEERSKALNDPDLVRDMLRPFPYQSEQATNTVLPVAMLQESFDEWHAKAGTFALSVASELIGFTCEELASFWDRHPSRDYLAVQLSLIKKRGVAVRRVFISSDASLSNTAYRRRLCIEMAMQSRLGIQVRHVNYEELKTRAIGCGFEFESFAIFDKRRFIYRVWLGDTYGIRTTIQQPTIDTAREIANEVFFLAEGTPKILSRYRSDFDSDAQRLVRTFDADVKSRARLLRL